METTRRRLLTGIAAGGMLAAALTGGGVAIAATGSAGSAPPATVLTAAGTPASPAAATVTTPNARHPGARGAVFRRFAWRHPHVVRSAFRSAAAYLGLTPKQLRVQLWDGKSLAQVAAARGKQVAGLENAVLAGAVKAIDAHTGWTAARKAAVTARVKSHLNAVVNATLRRACGVPAGLPCRSARSSPSGPRT